VSVTFKHVLLLETVGSIYFYCFC